MLSDAAVNYARTDLHLEVIKGTLEEAALAADYFDVATLWNVLDQTYDPKANLMEVNRILKKGGYVFLRLPNICFHLIFFRLYNRMKILFRHMKYTPTVFHLYSFDKKSIENILESTGFSDVRVEIEPMSANVALFVEMFGSKREKVLRKLIDMGAQIVYFLSFGKIIISPSLFVIARK